MPPDVNRKPNVDPNVSILSRLLLADDASFDVVDTSGKGLFKSARVKRRKPATGQIYGFKPMLAFGGNRSVDSIDIQPAVPHMALLAQASSFHLVDVFPYPPKISLYRSLLKAGRAGEICRNFKQASKASENRSEARNT